MNGTERSWTNRSVARREAKKREGGGTRRDEARRGGTRRDEANKGGTRRGKAKRVEARARNAAEARHEKMRVTYVQIEEPPEASWSFPRRPST